MGEEMQIVQKKGKEAGFAFVIIMVLPKSPQGRCGVKSESSHVFQSWFPMQMDVILM